MFEKFGEDARRVMVAAQHELINCRHGEMTTAHVLVGLFASTDSQLQARLATAGVTPEALHLHLRLLVQGQVVLPGYAPLADGAAQVLRDAGTDDRVTASSVLDAILTNPMCHAYRLLEAAGVDPEALSVGAGLEGSGTGTGRSVNAVREQPDGVFEGWFVE